MKRITIVLAVIAIPVFLMAVVVENGKDQPLYDILAAVKVVEINDHTSARWMGAAVAASGTTHTADQTSAGAAGAEAAAFSLDAGNDDWGAWVQIIGSSDTPVDSGNLFYAMHRILITATERPSVLYMIQMSFSAAAPGDDPSGTTYTEFQFISPGASPLAIGVQVPVKSPRVAVGTNLWARARVPNADTGTVGFYIGLHEYDE
jgi:hypothetical protein